MITYCTDSDLLSWGDPIADRFSGMSDLKKAEIVFQATLDIEEYHGQRRETPDTPWEAGDPDLTEAAVLQCYNIARYGKAMDTKQAISRITKGRYSDGIINATADGDKLNAISARIIREKLLDHGINRNEFRRG